MKYDYFQEEKLKYENIEIPDELLMIVQQTIAADRRKKSAARRARIIRIAGSVAAILFLCLAIGVNSSYAFAETAVKIPVVKNVAKAVIVRSYREEIIALDEQNNRRSEENPDAEQEPEGAVPAVSSNDVNFESEMPEQPAEQESEEVLGGFDAWKAEMTMEKFKEVTELYRPEMEDRYADKPEKLRTILLAELPDKDISLYGYHEDGKMTGTALRVKDTYQYFDWNYMNSTKKLPDISFADADGDGEEELIIFLYNGELQKNVISKEDIETPEESENAETTVKTTSKENEETVENTASDQNKATEKEVAASDQSKATGKGTAENIIENTVSGDNVEGTDTESMKPSVSGNDIKVPEKPKKISEQQAGELWVVSLEEENWSVSVLSIHDYESQIIHQLKAEYDEMANTVQLYLMEEPFGKPVTLFSEEDKLSYEAISVASEREFILEKGIFLHFQMEAVFSDADGGRMRFPLNMDLKAEIHLEDDSLIIENIEEQ